MKSVVGSKGAELGIENFNKGMLLLDWLAANSLLKDQTLQ